jgi:ferrochelatase
MDHSRPSIGVLLMAHGGPSSPEEVEPFLQKLLGRGVPAQRLRDAKRRYRLIGGGSPLLEITLRQARALEESLKAEDGGGRVYVGMRHWHPFIAESLGEIINDGIHRVVALSLSPYQSAMSTEQYEQELGRAIAASGRGIEVSVAEGWHVHPLFLQAWAERVKEGLMQFPAEVRQRVHVIFSAHSLPKRAIAEDPYVEQLEATIRGVVGITGSLPWRLAFQSGRSKRVEWLKPEVSTVLRELIRGGHREVLIAPVGFVADNVETLYDIDILYKQQAEEMGMSLRRSPCLNDSRRFIQALSSIVREHLMGHAWGAHSEMGVGN